jgi:hypothetical protein
MNRLTKLFALFLMVASLSLASTVTLIGDNTQPGFVALQVDGTTFNQALDYTGQRYASQGETWTANVYTYSQLAQAYYSPADPYINLAGYVTIYNEDLWLYDQLKTDSNPIDVAAIQEGVYFLSGASGYGTNSWVMAAQNDISLHGTADLGNLSTYRIVDSPFTIGGQTVPPNWLAQGFIYQVGDTVNRSPEPATWFLGFSGLLLVGLAKFRKV